MIKKLFTLLALLLQSIFAIAQEKEKQEIMEDAWMLYKSERASWSGTDIFLAKFPSKRNMIGGYFSYSENDVHKCIFFDKEAAPNVLATIELDDTFVLENVAIDSLPRKFTVYENDLYTLRQKTKSEVAKNTFFKHYDNSNFNIIPIIVKKKKKVYILTAPNNNGVVIFGNDYLLEFDAKNNIKSTKALHKNIIPINYGSPDNQTTAMHSHTEETGHLPTATDICTLLLYSQYANWDQHIIISKKYVSVWDSAKEDFYIITMEAWKKMSNLNADNNKNK